MHAFPLRFRISSAVLPFAFFFVAQLLSPGIVSGATSPENPKPNIVLINVDDADMDMFAPSTLALRFPNLATLADRSVKFTNAHATTPLCGPSRACLLRAQYAHHCGIRVNQPGLEKSFNFDGGMRSYVERGYAEDDLSTWMQDAGYHTMHVGKFLHHESLFMIPPGWDDFFASMGGRYYETHRITNRGGGRVPKAEVLPAGVYRTNAEADDVIALLGERAVSRDGKPFFLFLNPFGPHVQQKDAGEMYDTKYADLWPGIDQPLSPAYDEEDMSDRRGPASTFPRLKSGNHRYFSTHYRERMLSMKSVDDMVGRLVLALESLELSENTYIFVTSDNGFLLGHHRMSGKGFPAHRSTNVPLMVAGPGVLPGTSDHLLAHIDIGPTIVQLAGGATPDFVDGVSFTSLIADPENADSVRDHLIVENFEARSMLGRNYRSLSTSLRLKSAIYNEWAAGGREYFDLETDPEQLVNVIGDLTGEERLVLATTLRTTKRWEAAKAGFHTPYNDLDELPHPYVISGIAESTVSTRRVAICVRDLSTGKFWDGQQWADSFKQVDANIEQRNGMLTYWNLPLDFTNDQKPVGLVKAWAWGQDWSRDFQPPDTVVFKLGAVSSSVTLEKPFYAQRFDGQIQAEGVAVDGSNPELQRVEVRVRDVDTGQFWNGSSFQTKKFQLPVETDNGKWSYSSSLPAGTYRISVNGVDANDNLFDVTHRLFYVD